jgi:hypothetical protein
MMDVMTAAILLLLALVILNKEIHTLVEALEHREHREHLELQDLLEIQE